MFTVFYIIEFSAIAIIAVLLLADKSLRKRDTIDSKRIFHLAILVVLCSVLEMAGATYMRFCTVTPDESAYLFYLIPSAVFLVLREIFSIQIIFGWNLFIDYGINKSYDHVRAKSRKIRPPILILCIVIAVSYVVFYTIFDGGYLAVRIVNGLCLICYIIQLIYVINAIWIVLCARKRRTPPSFLWLEVFLIPVVFGYAANYIPVFQSYDLRNICMAIAVVLTWVTVVRRKRYINPYNGFYNRKFLLSMNEYMEKRGYPNGIGVYFHTPSGGEKLIPALNSQKPADSEIFSLGDNEFLLMAAPQKESLIRLLIRIVKLKAAEEDDTLEIQSSYTVREKDESPADFTKRLLKLHTPSDGRK